MRALAHSLVLNDASVFTNTGASEHKENSPLGEFSGLEGRAPCDFSCDTRFSLVSTRTTVLQLLAMNSPSDLSDEKNEVKPPETPAASAPKKSEEYSFKETVKFILIAIAIVVPIRLFIAQPFIVDGSSMDPTFGDRDYLIVDEISYRVSEPERGDVIVFKYPCPNTQVTNANECPSPARYYIKRIIGLPGDTVSAKPGHPIVIKDSTHTDGFELQEPYVENHERPGDYLPITQVVPPNEYFVMGDNRPHSSDSRIWGLLPKGNIVGRPIARLYPWSSIGVKPGEARY